MNRKKRGKGNHQATRKKALLCAVEDPIHPVQFWTNVKSQRRDPLLPEKKLWSAVLEDAFQCCVNGQVSAESSSARRQEEVERAKAWFLDERMDTGTFLWVCRMLNLDPKKIRKRVAGLVEKRRKAA
jgi:hypothetical protein